MIVRTFPDRLELITQPDHARLARAIMDHCVPLRDRPRHDAILLAISEHDSGWAGPDAAPIVNPARGAVFDFISAPPALRQAVWPRSIAGLEGDPWAAALVAQHALTVYDRLRPDGEWTPFFEAMEAARAALLRAAGLPLGDLLGGLRLRPSRRFDFAGVLLRRDRRAAVRCIHGQASWHACGRDARPLRRGGHSFRDRARVIPNRPFHSDYDLRRALREAATAILSGDLAARM